MKKNTWIRIAESVVFVLLLCAALSGVSRLMERKASRNQFGPFLEEPQQYDVLYFGDSRFVNCPFPMEIWADYGIPGYNLSCYGNTMPVNYWSMMNALDYAAPKVVVLAVNGVRKDLKVTGSSSDLHTALDFFPLSRTKMRAIEDLTDDPYAVDDYGNRYMDMRWEYYFTLGKYHERWSELGANDLNGLLNVQKGADMMVGVAPTEDYNLIDGDQFAEEQGVGYAYMRRMIEECQRRGIEILLVHLPYPASENAQMHANTVGSIAEEYGVNYVDFVYLDSVVDYTVDCYDQQAHLNPSGGLKVTGFIGEYLKTHYALEDKRSDPAYKNWDEAKRRYTEYKHNLLSAQDRLENVLVLLHDDDVSAQIAVQAHAEVYWNDAVLMLLHNMPRQHVYEEDAYSMWSGGMYPLDGLEDALWEDEAYFLDLNRAAGSMSESVGSEAMLQAQGVFGDQVWGEGKEVRIRVSDSETGETILDQQF